MTDREPERKALIPYSGNYPAQVQAAGMQLAIAAELNQDLRRRQLVAILKRIPIKDAITFVSGSMVLDADLLERFEDCWDWGRLSLNRNLKWTPSLIERFEKRWEWQYLSQNQAIPWSDELIRRFDRQWHWQSLSWNSALPWSFKLIDRFEDRWHWVLLAKHSDLPWSPDVIDSYKGRLSVSWFSENSNLPWSIELIQRYEASWNWNDLSKNKALPWSLELVDLHRDRWSWRALSSNDALPWSPELIERYKDRWAWWILAQNQGLPWSQGLIERYADRWDWGCLSSNSALPWSIQFIERFENRWGRGRISLDSDLPWSTELIERFGDFWRWQPIWKGADLPWSAEFIERYKDRWSWDELSRRSFVPWSTELIERFADRWNWRSSGLSGNRALPWSLGLVERFADRWDWGGLAGNTALPIPLLSSADVAEIMGSAAQHPSGAPTESEWSPNPDLGSLSIVNARPSRKPWVSPASPSPNTQAILLLTAPLSTGAGSSSLEILSNVEYKRLARHLREIGCQPADLISTDAADVRVACQPVVDDARLQRLLGRVGLLSKAIEQWQTRAIWVVGRADAEYPRRLKVRLREDAPAVIYGCGDMALLDSGGLAVVGSRDVDDSLLDYTMAVGRLAARAGRTLVSGGAKGIDQAAMRAALEASGKASGVLADSLEKTTMNREHRNLLLDGQLVLISPYDPSAGFNVGNAMQRNKLIYALADASLVVSSDLNKGGTWAGAVEQLDKLKFAPVYVRSTGEFSSGLDALRGKGAVPWPNPKDVAAFRSVLDVSTPSVVGPVHSAK